MAARGFFVFVLIAGALLSPVHGDTVHVGDLHYYFLLSPAWREDTVGVVHAPYVPARKIFSFKRMLDADDVRLQRLKCFFTTDTVLENRNIRLFAGGAAYLSRKRIMPNVQRLQSNLARLLEKKDMAVHVLVNLRLQEGRIFEFSARTKSDQRVMGFFQLGRLSSALIFCLAPNADSLIAGALLEEVRHSLNFYGSFEYAFRSPISEILFYVIRHQFMLFSCFLLFIFVCIIWYRKRDFVLVLFPLMIFAPPALFFLFTFVNQIYFR